MGKEIVKWMPTNQKMPKKGSNTLATIRIEDAWFEQKNNSRTHYHVDTLIVHAYFNEKGIWEIEYTYDPIYPGCGEPWDDDFGMALVDKENFSPFGNRYYELRENKKELLRRFIDVVAWIYAPVYPYGVSWDYLKNETERLCYADDYDLSEWHKNVIGYIGIDNKRFRQDVEKKLSEIKENQKNGLYDEPYSTIGDIIDELEYWLNLYEYIVNNNTIEEGAA